MHRGSNSEATLKRWTGSRTADGGVKVFSGRLKLRCGRADERRDAAACNKKMLFPAKLLGIYCGGGACESVGTAPLSPIISHFHSHQNTLIINETLPHTSWIRPLSECLIQCVFSLCVSFSPSASVSTPSPPLSLSHLYLCTRRWKVLPAFGARLHAGSSLQLLINYRELKQLELQRYTINKHPSHDATHGVLQSQDGEANMSPFLFFIFVLGALQNPPPPTCIFQKHTARLGGVIGEVGGGGVSGSLDGI